MNVRVGEDAEQNSALLTFLAGTWITKFAAHVRNDLGLGTVLRVDSRYSSATIRGHFKPLPDGGVVGHYMPVENPAGEDESTADCFLRLELDRTDNTLVAYLCNDKSAPAFKGVWSNSGVGFVGDFHDGIPMWEVFRAMWLQVTARPSIVSIIVRQTSESSWLLDVAFVVEQSFPSQATPVGLRCRFEFWHFREGPDGSTPPHPQDIEESFDEVLRRCDDVKQDIEFRIGEIDDLIASLECSKTKCEEGLRLLGELRSNAESGKDEVESLDDDMQEAILELHENPLFPAADSAVSGGEKRILARNSAELVGIRADAESLDSAIDSIEADIEVSDDLIGSVWTNAEYARAMQRLRENRDHLPAPDLSFLGPLQSSVSRLSMAATSC